MPARSRNAVMSENPASPKERAHRVRLVVTVLDHEPAAGRQAFARAADDGTQRRVPVDARRQRGHRFEAEIAFLQMRVDRADVRRIARDQVPRPGRNAVVPIGRGKRDVGQPKPARIVSSHGQRGFRAVRRGHRRIRAGHAPVPARLRRNRCRDRARAPPGLRGNFDNANSTSVSVSGRGISTSGVTDSVSPQNSREPVR